MMGKSNHDGNVETFIGPSVKVKGDFVGEGDLVVEGIVVGNLTTKNDLRVGKDALVEATIKSKNAYIAGRVTGNVSCKGKLELTGTAQILGDVKCMVLSVAAGGIINGKLDMTMDTAKAVENKEEELKEKK